MEPQSYSQVLAAGATEVGNDLFDRGEYDAAVAAHRKATTLWPESEEIWYNLARTLREVGDFDEALVAITRAVTLNAENPYILHALGNIYRSRKDFPNAVLAFQRALIVDPEFPAFNNLGLTYKNLNELGFARNAFQKGLKFQPDDPDLHDNLGRVFDELGDPVLAAHHYHQAATLNPDQDYIWSLLAGALRGCKRYQEAITAMREAIRREPDDALNYQDLGNIYREMGRHEEAAQAFQEAIQRGPQLLGPFIQLALSYLELGDPARAQAILENRMEGAETDEREELSYYRGVVLEGRNPSN